MGSCRVSVPVLGDVRVGFSKGYAMYSFRL